MVRLTVATKARLEALRARMLQASYEGRADYPVGWLDQLTLDTVIGVLLDRDAAHRGRKAKSAAKVSETRKQRSLYTVNDQNGSDRPSTIQGTEG